MPDGINRDYGRRPYISDDEYQDQMRGGTDKARDNIIKLPHSESKKPYMDDEYPAMEYGLTPFGFDPFDPGTWDDPRIPIDPEIDGVEWNDDKGTDSKFLGCDFGKPSGPRIIAPGQSTWVGLAGSSGLWNSTGGRADDPVVALSISYGPAKLMTSIEEYSKCMSQENCAGIVSVRAIDPIDETKYGKDATGMYPVLIQARTRSGQSCSFMIWIEDKTCPPDVELEYDWDNSAETIADGATVTVFILGGQAPFRWQVSGDGGFYLDRALTSDRSNRLNNASACGTATLTITDACGTVITGQVRSTYGSCWMDVTDQACGQWEEDEDCQLPHLAYDEYYASSVGFTVYYRRTQGGIKQQSGYDKDACDESTLYSGFTTYAEALAKVITEYGNCEAHCLNADSKCPRFCGGPRSKFCVSCLSWPTDHAPWGLNAWYGDPDGRIVAYSIGGSGSSWACFVRCMCEGSSSRAYQVWDCT